MTDVLAANQSVAASLNFPKHKLFLLSGPCVIESRELVMKIADRLTELGERLDMPIVFKASYDKANRSSGRSFRGPGLDEGLRILEDLGRSTGLPVVTDVHSPEQARAAGDVVDILQIPAFLSRQTDLVAAAASTGRAVNIKKAQFMAPRDIQHAVGKAQDAAAEAGFSNPEIFLTERGSCFGYNNLVVDMLGMDIMKEFAPVIFDATHALQMPGGRETSADGRRAQAAQLARSGMALGLAGLFIEAHPNPDEAKCDGPCALPLAKLEPYLAQMKALDDLVKGFDPLDTSVG